MEQISKKDFPTNLDSVLKQKAVHAIKNAISQEEYERYLEYSGKNLNERNEKMEKATIEIGTISEMKRMMEIMGFNQESVNDTISHENAHANKASQLGATHKGYKLLIVKKRNGEIILQPKTSIATPIEWSSEKEKEVTKSILMAPEEYDNKLSELDKKKLKEKQK